MFSIFKKPIKGQLKEYLEFKSINAPTMAGISEPSLQQFIKLSGIRDVAEIRIDHVKKFRYHLVEQKASFYLEDSAMRAVRGLLRYYHARGYPCPSAKAVK